MSEKVSSHLKELIKTSGKRRTDIARNIGVSPATIAHWSIGRRVPDRHNFIPLMRELNIAEEQWPEFANRFGYDSVPTDLNSDVVDVLGRISFQLDRISNAHNSLGSEIVFLREELSRTVNQPIATTVNTPIDNSYRPENV